VPAIQGAVAELEPGNYWLVVDIVVTTTLNYVNNVTEKNWKRTMAGLNIYGPSNATAMLQLYSLIGVLMLCSVLPTDRIWKDIVYEQVEVEPSLDSKNNLHSIRGPNARNMMSLITLHRIRHLCHLASVRVSIKNY
jgi:hypothetical protein